MKAKKNKFCSDKFSFDTIFFQTFHFGSDKNEFFSFNEQWTGEKTLCMNQTREKKSWNLNEIKLDTIWIYDDYKSHGWNDILEHKLGHTTLSPPFWFRWFIIDSII